MSSIEDHERELFWAELLPLIAAGDAVPVVGEELLQVSAESGSTTLYSTLARQYADQCGIQLEDALQGNLSATVRRHPLFFDKPMRISTGIAMAYSEANIPIPGSLRALAKIRHFNLFVSTTFDDLLERAVNEERFAGQKRTEVIPYAPNNVPADQTITDALASGRPVIFQLFGSYKTPGQYALTEADMVEYVHCLETNQKGRLLTELYERTLLLLGNSFPDWLTRILLRLARNNPLDDKANQKSVYVADTQVTNDPRLRFFLKNFVVNTEVVEGMSATEFVGELSKRWVEKFGGATSGAAPVTPAKSRPMPRDAVFISYCRSAAAKGSAPDAKMAFAIRDGLEARGVEVWLDKDRLQAGDKYDDDIKHYIETSSLFIPLISETTDARRDGYFRKEWDWAIGRLTYRKGSQRHFIVPVLIGPPEWRPKAVPEEFGPFNYARISGETPDAVFLDHIRSLYEEVLGLSQ
jgi:TIR domain-containing protein/SIR2-like protein